MTTVEMENSHFVVENNIIKSIEKSKNIMGNNDLGKTILEALSQDPNHIGQIEADTGKTTTFSEMKDQSIRCALRMEKQGLKADDIVFIFTYNRLDSYIPIFATFFVQSIYSAWGNNVNLDTARYIMKTFAPKLIFASEDAIDVLEEASKLEGHSVEMIIFGEKRSNYRSLKEITESQVENEVENYRPRDVRNTDETALIILTSGSTGFPRGVMYSSKSFLHNIRAHADTIVIGKKRRILLFGNIRWMGSLTSMLIAILKGATRIISLGMDPEDIFRVIEKYKVNEIITVPFVLTSLTKSPSVKKYDLTSLRAIGTGGLKVSEEIFKRSMITFPTAKVYQGYGTTESGFARIIPTQNYTQTNSNSIGFITSNMQLKIIDRINGEILGPRIPGEICIKSSTMMLGYYNNVEATEKAIDREGWLHTGDVGYFAENGEIFIFDRIVDLIKYRDEEIYPYEIEDILLTHPAIIEATVVPVSHELDGQRPVAFIQTLPGQQVTEKELIQLSSKLGNSKTLHAALRLSEHFPITAGDKVSKHQLAEYARVFFANKNV